MMGRRLMLRWSLVIWCFMRGESAGRLRGEEMNSNLAKRSDAVLV